MDIFVNFRNKLKSYGLYENMIIPNSISIYDYGTLKDNIFIRRGNLFPAASQHEGIAENMAGTFFVTDGTDYTTSANETTTDVSFSFSKDNSIYFTLNQTINRVIEDNDRVEQRIKQLYDDKIWDNTYVYIDRIINAKDTVLILAESKSTELKCSTPKKVFDKIGISANLHVTHRSGTQHHVFSSNPINALFGLKSITIKKAKQTFKSITQSTYAPLSAKWPLSRRRKTQYYLDTVTPIPIRELRSQVHMTRQNNQRIVLTSGYVRKTTSSITKKRRCQVNSIILKSSYPINLRNLQMEKSKALVSHRGMPVEISTRINGKRTNRHRIPNQNKVYVKCLKDDQNSYILKYNKI